MTRVALVTAAGSGIGAAVARRLSAAGYLVGLFSSSGRAEHLAQELGGFGSTGSNKNSDDLRRLVEAGAARGNITAVVNSAAHGPKGDLLELSEEDWREGHEVYFMNVVRMMRWVTPHLIAGGGGAVVNISSFSAVEPDPAFPTSSVYRAGLSAYARLFARRYAADGVRMNNLLPGFVDSLPEQREHRSRIPMGRYGTTEELARTAEFLLSDGAAYITGQDLVADGGLTRGL